MQCGTRAYENQSKYESSAAAVIRTLGPDRQNQEKTIESGNVWISKDHKEARTNNSKSEAGSLCRSGLAILLNKR